MNENPTTSFPSTSSQSLPTERPRRGNNRRCRRCSRLTINRLLERKQIKHHSSLEAMELSARLGCDFCQFIIDCLKMTQAKKTESTERGVSVKWDDHGDNDWKDTEQSLYAVTKESDQPSSITFTIYKGMRRKLPSQKTHTGETPDAEEVYETLLVQIGDLRRMELNLIVSRGDNIYTDEPVWYIREHARHRVGRYPIDPDLGSTVNLSIAKGWLDDCRENHAKCRPVKSSCLPTRVLDVGVSESLHTCRLVETSNKEGIYVALSHCWGAKIKECLTTNTLPNFLRSIQISQLPANFRDAIYVTRKLGMRYLWIDALCILQDSKDDWASESEKMGSIYHHSTLTIFAMTSRGSEEGFLKTANPPHPNPTTLKVSSATDNETFVIVARRDVEEENIGTLGYDSALSNRGWAFQEAVLSNQSLFFGARQLYWQCRKEVDSLEGLYPFQISYGLAFEVTVPQIDGQRERSDIGSAKLDFYILASKYNSKLLTYSSDKLPAFSGLAQKFQHVFGGEYLAGLWSNDIHRGLLWYLHKPLPSDSSARPNRLPSWSWASTNEWVHFRVTHNEELLQLHHSDVQLCNPQNLYGQISSESDATRPSITVIGMTMPLARGNKILDPHDQRLAKVGHVSFDVFQGMEDEVYDGRLPGIPMAIIDNSFMLSLMYPVKEEEEAEEEGKGQWRDAIDPYPGLRCNYLALAVSGEFSDERDVVHGLILQRSGDAFKRVGLWSLDLENLSWKGWKKDQRLKLI